MKKKFFLVLIGLISSVSAIYAEGGGDYWPKKNISLGFIQSTLKQEFCPNLKSNYGASFSVGRTFFLHKPIANVLRFGIDATWFDACYTNYEIEKISNWGKENFSIHEAEVAMQIGPSININPVSKLNVSIYGRYAPSFTCFYADSNFKFGYASYIVAGANISYSVIGVGIESRIGQSKLDTVLPTISENETDSKVKTKTTGLRAYITFKF